MKLIIFTFALGVFLLSLLGYGLVQTLQNYSPKFAVGECFRAGGAREAWDKPAIISRVEEIGNKAYRIRLYNAKYGYSPDSETQPFIFNNFYDKVDCP